MPENNIFKRYEIKYLITRQQKDALLRAMELYMTEDAHGRSTIENIYFDTPDFLLIRRSIEGPVYKEKLRLRSYGRANADTEVYAELKKKYRGIVYKRRIAMPEQEAMEFLCGTHENRESQIGREITWLLAQHPDLAPTVLISYEREAYFGKEDPDLRITFDENIRWRDMDLSLRFGAYGNEILESEQTLMEIKTAGAMPLWLTHFLTEQRIYKTSFSKYGRAYLDLVSRGKKGGRICA